MYTTVPSAAPGLVRWRSLKVAPAPASEPEGSPCSDFGKTEVQHLGLPASGHEDVRWLDIAMTMPELCATSSASAS